MQKKKKQIKIVKTKLTTTHEKSKFITPNTFTHKHTKTRSSRDSSFKFFEIHLQ